MQDESMIRYVSPVNPAVYPHLAVTLLVIGLFFTAWFFVYPQHTPPYVHASSYTLDDCLIWYSII